MMLFVVKYTSHIEYFSFQGKKSKNASLGLNFLFPMLNAYFNQQSNKYQW